MGSNPIRHLEIIQQGNPAKEAIKGVELLEQTIKDSSKSIQKEAKAIADALKKVNTTTKKGQEETRKAAENTKKLSVRQKENIRLSKELVKTKERLRTAQGIVNKGLIANRIELNKVNKETKQNIVLSKSQKGSYDRLAVSLNKNIAKWKGMSEAERKNTSQGKKLTAQIKQQDAALKKLDKQIGRSQRNVGNYSSAFVSLGSAMGVTLGAAGIFMVLKNAIGVISGFEKEMAKVKAISGATTSEFAALEKQAQDLGATTLFTAQQVATLEVAYSKLGFSTQEILNATAATLDLAVATDSDLAGAAEVAGSTIRGFGKDASETRKVVDIMAKSFTTTALNLEKFASGMANVQVAAKSTNRTLPETAAMLGTIVDTGTDASKAGTDLRRIFSQLAKKGIDLNDAYEMINTSQDKVVTAMELVGDRAFSSLITLATYTDKVNTLTEAYKNSDGAARDMAAIMENTLAASVTLLGSAWDGLILKMGGESGGVLKENVDFLTALLNKFIDIDRVFSKSGIIRGLFDFKNILEEINAEEATLFDASGLVKESVLAQKSADELGDILDQLESDSKSFFSSWQDAKDKGNAEKQAFFATQLDITKQNITATENALNDTVAIEAAIIKKGEDEKRAASKVAAAKAVADKETFNKFILENEQDLVDEEIEIIGDGYDQEYLDNKEKNAKIDADDKALMDSIKQNNDERVQDNVKTLDEIAAEEERHRQKVFRIIAASISAIGRIGNVIFGERLYQIDQETQALQKQKDFELSMAGDNAEAIDRIHNKFADKERKLKEEKAKTDKRAAVFSAVINTALGVTAALSQLPPYSYILAAITAAAGAVEIAAIASRPLPKFEKGGHGVVEGKRHSQGGVKIDRVGEVEKGEHFGVINRENTSKYANELPSIFDSLNNGNFEDIWQRTNDSLNVSVNDKYGKKMYNEMQKKETMVGGRRVVKKGNRTLYLN